ncbi:MAG: hypothetical protein AAF564_02805 [Bacteroidota bacterium]
MNRNTSSNKSPKSLKSLKSKKKRIVSSVIAGEILVETVFQKRAQKTQFCISQNGVWHFMESLPDGESIIEPYSAKNNLLQHKVLLLAEEPIEYGTQEELVTRIQAFIHKYVHVSPRFEKLASYYVLLTWIYDCFNELPYLRLKGNPGSGKTRFLLIVGSICYKPLFASGASTVSPLFRMLDKIQGTLILDEGDFRLSDERAEIVKILNNGNARGFPVLRSEVTPWGEYSPHAFYVYGPKIVATRKAFEDPALETRCITEEMGTGDLRRDIPLNLTEEYENEALRLRNQLLMFRLRSYRKQEFPDLSHLDLEPRLIQVLRPLFSIIQDEKTRQELIELATEYQSNMEGYRGMQIEAQILQVIADLKEQDVVLSVRDITSWFNDRYTEGYDKPLTARGIGRIIRESLQLTTRKSNGVFIVPPEEYPKLSWLFKKYSTQD